MQSLEMLPNYKPLFSEIVTIDCYRLRSIEFVPNIIFDIGANIGVFSLYALELFPDVSVIAVEPHPPNFDVLQHTLKHFTGRVVLLNKGVGYGPLTRYPDKRNRSITGGEGYHSNSSEYTMPPVPANELEVSSISSVLLSDLIKKYVQPGQKFLVKIDCEGAENFILKHLPSLTALRKADFIAAELHPYWSEENRDDAECMNARVCGLFQDTHRCEAETPLFWARKLPQ